jgi:hypothetical protein
MNKSSLHISLLIAAGLLSACSFSESSKSSSGSSKSLGNLASSPSASISRSSETEREAYEHDIRDYTAEFAKSSTGGLESFRVRVGKIAEKHGITNWQEDKSTYVAIGKGLRKAGLSQPQYEAFKSSLTGSQPQKMEYIQEGYKK